MEGFLEPVLKRIVRDAPKKEKELRDSCTETLEMMAGSHGKEKDQEQGKDSRVDTYVKPLLLACRSGQPKLIVVALDCLQKLMSYGYLRGNRLAVKAGLVEEGDKAGRNKTVMDVIVQVICACEDTDGKNFVPDDSVQLQVIKALLTAVTCATCGVHETSLLNSVRACYHIHLYSKNTVNKTTAKATLTQMMNSIFQQMEMVDLKIEKRLEKKRIEAAVEGETTKEEEVAKEEETAKGEEEPNASQEEQVVETPVPTPKVESYLDGCMYGQVVEFLAMPSLVKISLPTNGKVAATGAVTQNGVTVSNNDPNPFRSILHKDAYLLFRALCKLSMKNQTLIDGKAGSEAHIPDPIALRSKILSLDLVLNILENSGAGFHTNKDFIYAIKTYLCSSLIKNCVSSNTQVVGLSLRIFVALQSKFAVYLTSEIELVISKIFLAMLESSNSPYEHKVLVLEVFLQICKDVETLVSIFLNYDCDWDSIDLYTRIVKVLSKIASEAHPVPPANAKTQASQEEVYKSTLHAMALKSIVSIVESLAEFSHLEDQLPSNVVGLTETPHNPQEEVTENSDAALPPSPVENEDVSVSTPQQNGASKSVRKLKVDSFQQKRKYMRDVASAASKFAIKPKKGIDYLVTHGYIDHTPEDVAAALLQFKDEFSKTVIGEFLGEDKEFNVQTLYCYVDQFKFEGMLIDEAVRLFLSGFRLPGEAQKIDRMMEKFAALYCEHNPDTFPSADTAYVLAFSIIMLNTDLHNPNIAPEKKMSQEGFTVNNRGIAGGRDLAPEFLNGIYNRIKENAISLKEDDGEREKQKQKESQTSSSFFSSARDASRQKRVAFSKERQEIVQSATTMLSNKKQIKAFKRMKTRGSVETSSNGEPATPPTPPSGGDADTASFASGQEGYLYDSNDHVPPMFAVTWAPFCAVFSVNLQNTDEFVIINTVVNGMKSAIRIACRFNMDDELKTLLNALIKFTWLNTTQKMQPKHIQCIQALLEVVQSEGDYLGSCWEQALLCFSQLARLQLYSSGDDPNAPQPGHRRTSTKPGQGDGIFSYFQPTLTPEEQARITDEDNATKLLKAVDMIQIDRVFLDSVNLGTAAIVDMVQALCKVSSLELQIPNSSLSSMNMARLDTKPRIFCLQKIVEVADTNMDVRPRFVWGQVWAILSAHFTTAGCHPDVHISMYAVDSLRQLSVKFLEKDELAGFSFQLQFMVPFVNMMSKSKSDDLRDLVLRCIENIVLAKSRYLKSGWRCVLNVLTIGGDRSSSKEVNNLAFSILQRIVKDHLHAIDVYFLELVACLVAFASNGNETTGLSENALTLLESAFNEVLLLPPGETMTDGEVPSSEPVTPGPFPGFSTFNPSAKEQLVRLWPLIDSLCSLVGDDRAHVRKRATTILFSGLGRASNAFSADTMSLVFRFGLFRLFDGVFSDVTPFTEDSYSRLKEKRGKFYPTEQEKSELKEFRATKYPAPKLAVLLEQGSPFTSSTMYFVLSSMLDLMVSLFDKEKYAGEDGVDEWRTSMEEMVKNTVIAEFIITLEWLIVLDSDGITNMGINMLKRFLGLAEALRFTDREWHLICMSLISIMQSSTPESLTEERTRKWLHLDDNRNSVDTDCVEEEETVDTSTNLGDGSELIVFHKPKKDDPLPFQTKTVFSMCSVQLQIIQLIGTFINPNIASIGEKDILLLLDMIQKSVDFARGFNDDLALRVELHKRGFMSNDVNVPSLLRQEALALTRYIHLLFKLNGKDSNLRLSDEANKEIDRRLEERLHNVFMHYLFQDRMLSAEKEQGEQYYANEESEAAIDMRFFTPVVVLSLKQVLEWKLEVTRRNLPWLYPLLTALLDCGNREVHAVLRQVFEVNISRLLGLDAVA
mmetsp:Transcript_410/g.501  ORF Transcript_410/g.501 Transcript_410/m.501 type:complete len:1858 (-) Transcript_410:37-5610(-)|eukprot:CAMPEP_0203748578 /NCGR_PEP_ID=MMETSP0098-20131031/3423_1 /ASSEMBLY_ACC=CAM_ASM_000208 /TAXON_ID=96639 /ORGANISM=" , Strain NY0313808BC1" /LENGTH=1857 /DNA_ID=CAMNT_0050637361 /DNA_START=303 /DNA_END=5876 /DNA_ORIENTATION=+